MRTPTFLLGYGPTLSSESLTVGRYIGMILSVIVAVAVKVFDATTKP
jgi:hypothetical protein